MSPEDSTSFRVYRCQDCGKLDVRRSRREDHTCPECGSEGFTETTQVEDAIGYDVANRRFGPSVEDGRLGRMAFFAGWMTFDQIAQCLQRQQEAIGRGETPSMFGEIAMAEGLLTARQVDAILRMQAIHDNPTSFDNALGAVAVRQGFISLEDLDDALALQKMLLRSYQDAPRLGTLLADQGRLSSEQVKAILEVQAGQGRGPLAKPRREPAEADDELDAEVEAEDRDGDDEPLFEILDVPAEDLTRDRLLCLCKDCGATEVRAEWTRWDPCPSCQSDMFSPVSIRSKDLDAAARKAGAGPSIEDTRLGRIAYFAGWLTPKQIKSCLAVQQKTVQWGGPRPRLGEVALHEGHLNQTQLNALLRIQSVHRSPKHERAFGAIAVNEGWVTRSQLDDCLDQQKRLLREKNEAPSLGLLMAEKRLLTDRQVKSILASQARATRVQTLRHYWRQRDFD